VPEKASIKPGEEIPTTRCDRPDIPEFVINIPVSAVFYNPPSASLPAGLNIDPAANFTVDLFDVQQKVLDNQRS